MSKIRSQDDSSIEDRRGQSSGGFGGMRFPGGGSGGGGFPFPIKTGGGIGGVILVLAIILLPRILGGGGGAGSQGAFDLNNIQLGGDEVTAGDGEACSTELEQTLCGAVNDVQTFWGTQYPDAFGGQYEKVNTVFFSGSTNTGCGAASAETGPFYCPADQKVYFDLDFLVSLQDRFGATGDLATQYIVAHEYGHHIQNLNGNNAAARQAQENDPANAGSYSIQLELQADCYAGVWAHDAATRDQFDDNSEIDEAINAAKAVGDDRIQEATTGRVDEESWTHGSSAQRAAAFTQGYESGAATACASFDI